MRDYIIENACCALVRKTEQLCTHPSQMAAQFGHQQAGERYVITVLKIPKEEAVAA